MTKLVLCNHWLFPVSTFHFGLASLAAYIKETHPQVSVKIIEGENIFEEIIVAKPDIVGFTCDTVSYLPTVELAKKIRKTLDIPLIVGGVHVTAMPKIFDPVFQIGVIGEGEVTLSELLTIFEKYNCFPNRLIRKVKGIVFRDKGKVILTKKRELVKNIDRLPYPARELVPMNEVYLKNQVNLFGVSKMAAIMSSRGCPYKCVFCGSPVQWGGVRFHSAEYVVKEIEFLLTKYGIDGIIFWDDFFISPKERLIKMADLIRKKGLNKKITFFGYARANLINEDICLILQKMNVKRLIFGLESGSEKILDFLKEKTVKVEDNKRALLLCRKYKISTSSGFIVGTPGETVCDLQKTYQFMKKYPLDNSYIYILTPYPGTKIWNLALRYGLISNSMDFGRLFVQFPPPSIFDYFRKEKKNILEGRIFLNIEYQTDKKYLKLIFKMHKMAHFQNMLFYLKNIFADPKLLTKLFIREVPS